MARSYPSGMVIAVDSFVDLQTHTTFSDGAWIPGNLIDYFLREGFATAAITDHDRVDTMAELQTIAQERRFPLLVATEMTTQWRGGLVDILCFGFEANPAPLHELGNRILQAQTDASRNAYQALVRDGHVPHHDEAELITVLGATTSKQPHLLFDVLLRHLPNVEKASVALDKVGYPLCTNPTFAVVEAAHQGGGVALIAHPGRTDGFTTFDANLLDQFRAEIPIDGIEAYYPRHTPEQVSLYEAYAAQNAWLISAGSDSHTPDKAPIKYRAGQCMALLARLGIQVG